MTHIAKKLGRPYACGEPARTVPVRLTEAHIHAARDYGGGNLSAGIRRLIAEQLLHEPHPR